jgi:hypothetical protein
MGKGNGANRLLACSTNLIQDFDHIHENSIQKLSFVWQMSLDEQHQRPTLGVLA